MNDVIFWSYITDVIDSINDLATLLLIVMVIFTIREFIGTVVNPNYAESSKRILRIIVPISIISGLILIALPSDRTMLTIVASKATPEIVKTDEGQKIIQVLNKKLDDYLKKDN